jgi:hypothetical protein
LFWGGWWWPSGPNNPNTRFVQALIINDFQMEVPWTILIALERPFLPGRLDPSLSHREAASTLRHPQTMKTALLCNDIHSKLNATTVAEIVLPSIEGDVIAAIHRARSAGKSISICGGRHAMGGQQFGEGTILLDMTEQRSSTRKSGTIPRRLFKASGGGTTATCSGFSKRK